MTRNIKFCLIAGAFRSGKDTFADFLIEEWPDRFFKLPLAKPLRKWERMIRPHYFSMVMKYCERALGEAVVREVRDRIWNEMEGDKNGPVLQILGTDIARRIDDAAFCCLLIKSLEHQEDDRICVVTDCRFPNEFYHERFTRSDRVVIYCQTPTIERRLRETRDERVPFKHESEWMARQIYDIVEKVGSPGFHQTDIMLGNERVPVYNTSDQALSLDAFKQQALLFGEDLLRRAGDKEKKRGGIDANE